MSRIYTRTGDKGKCSLGGGKRVFKDNVVVEALGAVDELNAVIGCAESQIINLKSQSHSSDFKLVISDIQTDLFNIGAILSGTDGSDESGISVHRLSDRVDQLEESIDKISRHLPELNCFILPGGSKLASLLHLARAVCRRAERRVVKLQNSRLKIKNIGQVIVYLNRLSDFLFILARWANAQEGIQESKY